MGDHIPATPPMTTQRGRQIDEWAASWRRDTGALGGAVAIVDELRAEVARLITQVAARVAELESYEMLTPQECEAKNADHPDWLADTKHHIACPWCQIDRLVAELQTMRQRVLALADQHEYQRGEGFLLEASDRLMSAALREVPALIRAAVQDQPAELKGSAGNLSLTGENASPLEDDPPPPQRPRRPWDVAFANLPALDELRARMNAAAAELLTAFNLGAQPLRIRDEPDGATTYARLDREHGPPPPAPFVHSNGRACFGCQSCLDDGGPDLAEAVDRG